MKLHHALLVCISLVVSGAAHALVLTDTAARVPGSSERKEDFTGGWYRTAWLKSSDPQFYFSARAETSLGINGVLLEMYDPIPTGNWAEASSYWRDEITITVPTGICGLGASCSLRAGVDINFSLFDFEASWLWLNFYANGSGVRLNHDDDDVCYGRSGDCSVFRTLWFDLDFKNGRPFDVWSGLYGGVKSSAGHTAGYVYAHHTAAFNHLELPPGSTVISASGTVYPVPYGTAVWEPGTLALTLSGLACLGAIGRRGRRRATQGVARGGSTV